MSDQPPIHEVVKYAYCGVRWEDGKKWHLYKVINENGVVFGNGKLFHKQFTKRPVVGGIYKVTYSKPNNYYIAGEHEPVSVGMYDHNEARRWRLEHEAALIREREDKLRREEMKADLLADMTLAEARRLYQNAMPAQRKAILAVLFQYILG